MSPRARRIALSVALDALVVVVLTFPSLTAHLRWPIFGLYLVLTALLVKRCSDQRWILGIVDDSATRIAHGLEHATLAVLEEDGHPATHGFTHGTHRFVVALTATRAVTVAAVHVAVTRAIQRILAGERSLAYQPGCGTSEVASAATLWLVYTASTIISLALTGSMAVSVAAGVILFRIWLACETSFGLLAQRLYTVSTAFSSARVTYVREVSRIGSYLRPVDEVWFEVMIDVRTAPSRGGVIAPGALP